MNYKAFQTQKCTDIIKRLLKYLFINIKINCYNKIKIFKNKTKL